MMFIKLTCALFKSKTFEVNEEDHWESLNEGLDLNIYFDEDKQEWDAAVYACYDGKTNTDVLLFKPKVEEWWVPPTLTEKAGQALKHGGFPVELSYINWQEQLFIRCNGHLFRISDQDIDHWAEVYDYLQNKKS
jgi:hypothetical protein